MTLASAEVNTGGDVIEAIHINDQGTKNGMVGNPVAVGSDEDEVKGGWTGLKRRMTTKKIEKPVKNVVKSDKVKVFLFN